MISQNLNITMFDIASKVLNFKIRKNDYNFNRIVVIALNAVSGNWAEKLVSAMFYQIFISY